MILYSIEQMSQRSWASDLHIKQLKHLIMMSYPFSEQEKKDLQKWIYGLNNAEDMVFLMNHLDILYPRHILRKESNDFDAKIFMQSCEKYGDSLWNIVHRVKNSLTMFDVKPFLGQKHYEEFSCLTDKEQKFHLKWMIQYGFNVLENFWPYCKKHIHDIAYYTHGGASEYFTLLNIFELFGKNLTDDVRKDVIDTFKNDLSIDFAVYFGLEYHTHEEMKIAFLNAYLREPAIVDKESWILYFAVSRPHTSILINDGFEKMFLSLFGFSRESLISDYEAKVSMMSGVLDEYTFGMYIRDVFNDIASQTEMELL